MEASVEKAGFVAAPFTGAILFLNLMSWRQQTNQFKNKSKFKMQRLAPAKGAATKSREPVDEPRTQSRRRRQ
jgi:hypothetical protein